MSTKYNVNITIDGEDYAVIMNALQSRAARLKEGSAKQEHIGDVMTAVHKGWSATLKEEFRNAR